MYSRLADSGKQAVDIERGSMFSGYQFVLPGQSIPIEMKNLSARAHFYVRHWVSEMLKLGTFRQSYNLSFDAWQAKMKASQVIWEDTLSCTIDDENTSQLGLMAYSYGISAIHETAASVLIYDGSSAKQQSSSTSLLTHHPADLGSLNNLLAVHLSQLLFLNDTPLNRKVMIESRKNFRYCLSVLLSQLCGNQSQFAKRHKQIEQLASRIESAYPRFSIEVKAVDAKWIKTDAVLNLYGLTSDQRAGLAKDGLKKASSACCSKVKKDSLIAVLEKRLAVGQQYYTNGGANYRNTIGLDWLKEVRCKIEPRRALGNLSFSEKAGYDFTSQSGCMAVASKQSVGLITCGIPVPIHMQASNEKKINVTMMNLHQLVNMIVARSLKKTFPETSQAEQALLRQYRNQFFGFWKIEPILFMVSLLSPSWLRSFSGIDGNDKKMVAILRAAIKHYNQQSQSIIKIKLGINPYNEMRHLSSNDLGDIINWFENFIWQVNINLQITREYQPGNEAKGEDRHELKKQLKNDIRKCLDLLKFVEAKRALSYLASPILFKMIQLMISPLDFNHIVPLWNGCKSYKDRGNTAWMLVQLEVLMHYVSGSNFDLFNIIASDYTADMSLVPVNQTFVTLLKINKVISLSIGQLSIGQVYPKLTKDILAMFRAKKQSCLSCICNSLTPLLVVVATLSLLASGGYAWYYFKPGQVLFHDIVLSFITVFTLCLSSIYFNRHPIQCSTQVFDEATDFLHSRKGLAKHKVKLPLFKRGLIYKLFFMVLTTAALFTDHLVWPEAWLQEDTGLRDAAQSMASVLSCLLVTELGFRLARCHGSRRFMSKYAADKIPGLFKTQARDNNFVVEYANPAKGAF